MAPSVPSTTCLIYSESGEVAAQVPCDSQHIFLPGSDGNIQKLPHPCHVTSSTHNLEDEIEDWQRWLASKLSVVLQTRDAAPEPEPKLESEMAVEVMDATNLVRRKSTKSRPKTTVINNNNSSAAGRTVVGALGLWVVVGWVLAAAV